MENSQKSWVISEAMKVETASASSVGARTRTRSSRAKSTRRSNQKVTKAKRIKSMKRSPRAKAKKLTGASYIMITAIIVFVVGIGLLFQQSIISELNEEVRTMQGTLSEKQGSNDSKEGQLVAGMNDMSGIEATARAYGMTTPNSGQYLYETKMGTTQRASTESRNSSWIRLILQ